MRRCSVVLAYALILTGLASAQQPTFRDGLLDHLAGTWVLQGTIAGKQTTHDISGEWVLEHQYLRLNEVAREKKANGEPGYQAMVFIGWNQTLNQYACFWLDNFGGAFDSTVGYAKRAGDEIAFLFQYPEGPFHTTFTYDAKNDTWQLSMDSEEKGTKKTFARAKLVRK